LKFIVPYLANGRRYGGVCDKYTSNTAADSFI